MADRGNGHRHDRDTRHKRRNDGIHDEKNGSPSKARKGHSVEDFDYFALGKRKADLKKRFDAIDTNGNGTVCVHELKKAKEFKGELAASDMNRDDEVTFEEFWTCMKNSYWPEMGTAEQLMAGAVAHERNRLWNRFLELDVNNDGVLTMGEIYNIDNALLDIFYKIDKNKDSKMTFEELWDHVSPNIFSNIPEEVKLRVFFQECDYDGSGYLDYQEMCENSHYRENEEISKSLSAMMEMDTNKDGKVSVEEFLSHWRETQRKKDKRRGLKDYETLEVAVKKAHLREAFDRIDTDKSGKICKKEIENAKELQMELGLSDIDDDGLVSFDELWSLMKNAYWRDMTTAEEAMAGHVADERWRLRQRFYELDKDENGILTMGEIYGIDNDLLDIFHQIDKDKDSKMTFDELWEFVSAKIFVNVPEEVNLRAFFDECDYNRDGYLSYQEVCESLYYKENEKLAKSLDAMMDMDTNKDGKVSIEEFLDNWRKMQRKKPDPSEAKKPAQADKKASPAKTSQSKTRSHRH